jgi:transcriptional regulator with XRE-family HTH domain
MDAKVLGRQVLDRRKKLGLSQGALADQAGISRNYVSLIERGEADNVSVNVLNQLATALGTTPAELSEQSGWVETLIPPPLREFALQNELSFDVVDKLARLPMRGKEPSTVDEWKQLYKLVQPYLEKTD